MSRYFSHHVNVGGRSDTLLETASFIKQQQEAHHQVGLGETRAA